MNILYLSTKKKWGGVVSLYVRTARQLERRGHRVWIVSNRNSSLTRHAPSDIHLVARTAGMDFNPFLIAFLIRLIKNNAIDLIVSNIKKEVIAAGVAARLCRLPSIRFIGNEKDVDDHRWLQQRLVDKYVFPCHTSQSLAMASNPWLRPEDCQVIHNGHNRVHYPKERIIERRRQWGIPDEAIIIGFSGRLVRSKGVASLIRAFAEVTAQRPATWLVIAGEGKHKAEFQNLVAQWGLDRRVIFLGFVTDPLLCAATYDIAVLPSHYEAFPYAIVEYFAVGRPVVASDVGGVREIIRDGENGRLFSAGNVPQLGQCLLELVDDADLRNRYGQAALQAIDTTFSEERMIDRFEHLFLECLRK